MSEFLNPSNSGITITQLPPDPVDFYRKPAPEIAEPLHPGATITYGTPISPPTGIQAEAPPAMPVEEALKRVRRGRAVLEKNLPLPPMTTLREADKLLGELASAKVDIDAATPSVGQHRGELLLTVTAAALRAFDDELADIKLDAERLGLAMRTVQERRVALQRAERVTVALAKARALAADAEKLAGDMKEQWAPAATILKNLVDRNDTYERHFHALTLDAEANLSAEEFAAVKAAMGPFVRNRVCGTDDVRAYAGLWVTYNCIIPALDAREKDFCSGKVSPFGVRRPL